LRETTARAKTLLRSVMMSSVMPSLKYSCSRSPLIPDKDGNVSRRRHPARARPLAQQQPVVRRQADVDPVNRGQALFQVAHDSARRFRIAAGAAGVIAVGTRFDVYRKVHVTMVTVAEGQVAVFTGAPVWLRSAAGAPAYVLLVEAGYQVRVDAGAMSAQPVPVDLRQALGWLRHKIVFERRPLGEVAAEFNRYGRIPVEIEDANLRALPVSGTFDADDTDSFVAFLETLPDIRMERTPMRIRVVKVTPTT
jgi:transmembrane sensor